MKSSFILSLLVASGMPKLFYDGENGRIVPYLAGSSVIALPGMFLCAGIQTRFKENCIVKPLSNLRQYSTVLDFAVGK